MTIKELKQFVANKKKAKTKEWKKQIEMHGECDPFKINEYQQNSDIIFVGKKYYKTKFTHRRLWEIIK